MGGFYEWELNLLPPLPMLSFSAHKQTQNILHKYFPADIFLSWLAHVRSALSKTGPREFPLVSCHILPARNLQVYLASSKYLLRFVGKSRFSVHLKGSSCECVCSHVCLVPRFLPPKENRKDEDFLFIVKFCFTFQSDIISYDILFDLIYGIKQK